MSFSCMYWIEFTGSRIVFTCLVLFANFGLLSVCGFVLYERWYVHLSDSQTKDKADISFSVFL